MPDDKSPTKARRLGGALGKGHWFGGLPPELQRRILAVSRIRDFTKGAVIATQGQQPSAMAAIRAGQVKLIRQSLPGDEALLYVCEAGGWFGDCAVLTGEKTLVAAIAKTKARLLLLPLVAGVALLSTAALPTDGSKARAAAG